MNWSSFHVATWWPLLPAALGLLLLGMLWVRRKGVLFPDLGLVSRTRRTGGFVDRLPLLLGTVVAAMLVVGMMDVSVSRAVDDDKKARDFLVIVDTSRSMRESTSLLREQFPPKYERRVGLYIGEADDPARIPHLARYEVARQSLLHFLSTRRAEDRIALVYFNSGVFLMSGFTSSFGFIEQQLAAMDPYVAYGTNIRWALEQGFDMLERYPGDNRRAVILLTDAQTQNTHDFQQQMDRLRELDVAFYLLWITTDAGKGGSPLTAEFLRTARMAGSVYTIDHLGEGYLKEALQEIAKLEDYAYKEVRHERMDLSRYSLAAAQFLALAWVLLIGTLYAPLRHVAYVATDHHGSARQR